MKKNYTHFFMLVAMVLMTAQAAWAQATWKTHLNTTDGERTFTTLEAPAGNIYLGQCNYDDYIYEMDGLSLDFDARVGVGIKLTRDMFKDYIGGTIDAFRVGWDDRATMASYECFIRETHFNNTDLAKGKGTARFGWNEIKLSTPIALPDVDTLCIGFYVNLKKGVCSIPKFYPQGKPNSCFLYNGETTEDGQEIWYDSRELGVMPVMIKIVDKTGQFSNLINVTDVLYDAIVPAQTESPAFVTIQNKGSNNISKLEVTSQQGDQMVSTEVSLSKPITPTASSKIKLPIHCFGSGETTVKFTKVNGTTPNNIAEKKITLIGVPDEVAEQYVHRPVIEFFASENSYHIPSYYEDYFMPGYEPFQDYMTVVFQHTDDKYMIGDPDESILLQLGLANNDSSKIMLPDMCLNRSAYVAAPVNLAGTPFHYGILVPMFTTDYYTAVIGMPTFAGLNVKANFNESGDQVKIKVEGDIAPGILPEGEKLNLTVYFMENNVESTDQRFWDDKEGVQFGNTFVHHNIIRENLTPLWGKPLENIDGKFSMEFTADVYEDYNPANLGVIAFLNRGENNPHTNRQIVNSCEVKVEGVSDGIGQVTTQKSATDNHWYDLSGRRVVKPTKGIYVRNGQKFYIQ